MYEDGDEEDLELHELKLILASSLSSPSSSKKRSRTDDGGDGSSQKYGAFLTFVFLAMRSSCLSNNTILFAEAQRNQKNRGLRRKQKVPQRVLLNHLKLLDQGPRVREVERYPVCLQREGAQES